MCFDLLVEWCLDLCWPCWFALELRLCVLRLVERFLMGGFQPQQLSTYALTLFRCAPSNHSAQSIVPESLSETCHGASKRGRVVSWWQRRAHCEDAGREREAESEKGQTDRSIADRREEQTKRSRRDGYLCGMLQARGSGARHWRARGRASASRCWSVLSLMMVFSPITMSVG